LAEKAIAVTDSKSQIIRKPLPSDDPLQRQPDLTIARTKLGWKPRVSLDEGLKLTAAYFAALIGTQRADA